MPIRWRGHAGLKCLTNSLAPGKLTRQAKDHARDTCDKSYGDHPKSPRKPRASALIFHTPVKHADVGVNCHSRYKPMKYFGIYGTSISYRRKSTAHELMYKNKTVKTVQTRLLPITLCNCLYDVIAWIFTVAIINIEGTLLTTTVRDRTRPPRRIWSGSGYGLRIRTLDRDYFQHLTGASLSKDTSVIKFS